MHGQRFCDRCRAVTPHTAIRRITPVGKGLMVAAIAAMTLLYVHNALRSVPGKTSFMIFYWALPAVFGLVVFVIALNRKGYHVRCRACSTSSFRLSPPRWVEEP